MEITNMSTFEKVFFGLFGGLLGGASFGALNDMGHPFLAWCLIGYMALAMVRMTETHATKED